MRHTRFDIVVFALIAIAVAILSHTMAPEQPDGATAIAAAQPAAIPTLAAH